jgi:hypothetical protein
LLAPRAGWTFDAGEDEDLATVLEQVSDLEPVELSAYGERARTHVEDHHTWQHRSRQLLAELDARGLV